MLQFLDRVFLGVGEARIDAMFRIYDAALLRFLGHIDERGGNVQEIVLEGNARHDAFARFAAIDALRERSDGDIKNSLNIARQEVLNALQESGKLRRRLLRKRSQHHKR